MGDDNIVIVDIDEKSLKTQDNGLGAEIKLAKLLQNLSDFGAAIIGLDIVLRKQITVPSTHLKTS